MAANKYLQAIPRTLTIENIDSAIEDYLSILFCTEIDINVQNILSLFTEIKRKEVITGPYPGLTLFEVANRVMTDLVILYGVKELLQKKEPYMIFDKFEVELGNENKKAFDIQSQQDGLNLRGEAFNVAKSFFQGKKASALAKLRKNKKENDIIVLIYNSDAPKKGESYKPKFVKNEYHLPVNLNFEMM